ncbi:MAG: ABC transporter permease [Hyphomicrobiales bacterium]|nr:ABC transporter permease [Hyphomicrobiales bacterium]
MVNVSGVKSLPVVVSKEQAKAQPPKQGFGKTPIVLPGSVTGRSLTMVVAIMCFLVCLVAGVVYMIRQSADAWLRDIDSEVTIQIQPVGDIRAMDRSVGEIVAFLNEQTGIAKVTPIGRDEINELVKPWLGSVAGLQALPMPQLIALEVDRDNPPDISLLRAALSAKFSNVNLDDHRRWRKQIRAMTSTLAIGGLAVIILMTAATAAIIVAAARSAMASNKEIIEVLNFVGAEEKFIVNQFERHFLKLGIKAGIVGASFAALIFYALPHIGELFGANAVADAEVRRVIGSGSLDLPGYGILVFMVVVIAGLCQLTSRIGVRRILEGQNK